MYVNNSIVLVFPFQKLIRLISTSRPAIPNSVTEALRKKVASAVFTSNPCRIQYCTQEIVVFREDIVTKMCRNCVKFPEDGDVPKHVSRE